MSPLHQHLPQVNIPFFGDSQLWLILARTAPLRPHAYVAADVPALLEPRFIFQRQYESESDQRSDSLHLLQESGFRIALPGDLPLSDPSP